MYICVLELMPSLNSKMYNNFGECLAGWFGITWFCNTLKYSCTAYYVLRMVIHGGEVIVPKVQFKPAFQLIYRELTILEVCCD